MRSSSKLSAVAVAVLLAAGCRGDDRSDLASGEIRAKAALAPFKASLQSALLGALADGGPDRAIDVCATEAPRLADAAAKGGVRVGRAASRLRKPANRRPPWVAPLLDDLAKSPVEGAHRTVTLPGDRVGYVEAIVMKPLCATCHGESVAAELRSRIASRYPHDEAIGFREGDLRGVFWVEVPAASRP